jgi:hypothetical protein
MGYASAWSVMLVIVLMLFSGGYQVFNRYITRTQGD